MQFLLAHLALCGLIPTAFPQLLSMVCWVLYSLFTPFLPLSLVLLPGTVMLVGKGHLLML